METNYERADNSNLPQIDAFMVALFFKNNADYCAAELKNVKTAIIAMNNPELYNATNGIQSKDTLQFLREYAHKIKWNKTGDAAIDVGCGDGSVSVFAKNFAPYKYKKYVASDINENMIKFASKQYAEEDISFRVLDIEGDLPEDLIKSFNHVFSFYALHWVKKQEKAFRNIYNLLTDDGDCFVTFIASTAIYDVYLAFANHPKWKTWLKESDVFVSPYHAMKNPDRRVAEILEKCGFTNIDVKHKPMIYKLDDANALKNMVQSVEPFNMPQDVFDEFIKDFIKVGQEIGSLKFHNDDNGQPTTVTYEYSLIVVYASK